VEEVGRMYSEKKGKYLGEEGPTTSRHHLDPELKDLLRKMGVPSRHLEKTADFLDRRIDEVAASTTQPPKRDR
jgi:hypothetical protein